MTDSDDTADDTTDGDQFSSTYGDLTGLAGGYSLSEMVEAERHLDKPGNLLGALDGLRSFNNTLEAFEHPHLPDVSATRQLLGRVGMADPAFLGSHGVGSFSGVSSLLATTDNVPSERLSIGSVSIEPQQSGTAAIVEPFAESEPFGTPEPEEQEPLTLEDLLEEIDADYEEYVALGERMGFVSQCNGCSKLFLRDNSHRLSDLDPDGEGDLQCGSCRDSGRSIQ